MPLGWERINTKKSHPNKNIVFIKPLPGTTEDTAKDFLERIAAQCLPITNTHYLAVTSLEEYEPNLEFWGRNFNNGEVIQLVLRSPTMGRWLPFKFVQMVMMHELAHCKEMNHGKAFWKVRNEYASDMKKLWEKGYTGDGLWGRGLLLENGAFAREELGDGEVLPEHMCGGTFKSRGGRKRKAPRPKITYREQKERRIKKKFGVNGMTLGADEHVTTELENRKKPTGKPRVAGSKRGRELRAAAALKRFEVMKEEPSIKDQDLVTDSESESDHDDVPIKAEPGDAIDINGERLLDRRGGGMVKVCEDDDKNNEDAQNELTELATIKAPAPRSRTLMSIPEYKPPQASTSSTTKDPTSSMPLVKPPITITKAHIPRKPAAPRTAPESIRKEEPTPLEVDSSCPTCTTTNTPTSLTCSICSHVLKPDFVPGSWNCASEPCQGRSYINAGDVGICGVCDAPKQS